MNSRTPRRRSRRDSIRNLKPVAGRRHRYGGEAREIDAGAGHDHRHEVGRDEAELFQRALVLAVVKDDRVAGANGSRETAAVDALDAVARQRVDEADNAADVRAASGQRGERQRVQAEAEDDAGLPILELRDEARSSPANRPIAGSSAG